MKCSNKAGWIGMLFYVCMSLGACKTASNQEMQVLSSKQEQPIKEEKLQESIEKNLGLKVEKVSVDAKTAQSKYQFEVAVKSFQSQAKGGLLSGLPFKGIRGANLNFFQQSLGFQNDFSLGLGLVSISNTPGAISNPFGVRLNQSSGAATATILHPSVSRFIEKYQSFSKGNPQLVNEVAYFIPSQPKPSKFDDAYFSELLDDMLSNEGAEGADEMLIPLVDYHQSQMSQLTSSSMALIYLPQHSVITRFRMMLQVMASKIDMAEFQDEKVVLKLKAVALKSVLSVMLQSVHSYLVFADPNFSKFKGQLAKNFVDGNYVNITYPQFFQSILKGPFKLSKKERQFFEALYQDYDEAPYPTIRFGFEEVSKRVKLLNRNP